MRPTRYALFELPAERRIRAGICPALFDDRVPKTTREDPRPSAFGRAREHYERLGIEERIEPLEHDGGHGVHVDGEIDLLDRHLR